MEEIGRIEITFLGVKYLKDLQQMVAVFLQQIYIVAKTQGITCLQAGADLLSYILSSSKNLFWPSQIPELI